MNTTEIQNKIAELEKDFAAKLAGLKSAIAEQGKKPGRWVPALRQSYFALGRDMEAHPRTNEPAPIDDILIKSGNCFQTREEAEARQLIAVPKGDADQMLWMVDYLRAGDGGECNIWAKAGLDTVNYVTNVVDSADGLPRWSTESKAREWVESHGGEAEVARRLNIGWPK